MLNLRQTKHLTAALGTTSDALRDMLVHADSYYEELLLIDPGKPEKPRVVVDVRGAMRRLQMRFYRRLLLPKLMPSIYSHGGVRGRSIKTNVEPHLRSQFVFKTDISNYYPSIHHSRVYRLFSGHFCCSPDVARFCTRLCTYRHHLALGLITSPILADQVLQKVDRRIGGACQDAGLVYTRYVDDITISGPFNLERSGFSELVEKILREDGYDVNSGKHVFGQLSGDISITNLRKAKGHLDVRKEYVLELERQLDDASRLARGEPLEGRPYYTESQILGRVRFVCWVNPGRRRILLPKFRRIPWRQVQRNARRLGLEASRKKLSRLKSPDRCS